MDQLEEEDEEEVEADEDAIEEPAGAHPVTSD